MKRISSLPAAEFCPRTDSIGKEVETTASARGTVFHKFCDTGVWPKELHELPPKDVEEISRWRVPMPFVYKTGNVTHALLYKDAYREVRVALDKDFNRVIVDPEIPQDEIETTHPEVMVVGHLDIAWVVDDLVIICDIKSSIWAVPDRCKSLQLHGYGMGLAALLGKTRYITSIWDATDGRYYVDDHAIELDSFEAEVLRDRIRTAASERDGRLKTGTHCSGCWKRLQCPAHMIDVPESEFSALLSGQAMEADVRTALTKVKQMEDLAKKVKEATQAWVHMKGPVRSDDGKKVYRVTMVGNKATLNEKAVAAALGEPNLSKYKIKEGEHPEHRWVNAE